MNSQQQPHQNQILSTTITAAAAATMETVTTTATTFTKMSMGGSTVKRIYGLEYREPTILSCEPQCKMLKLDKTEISEIINNNNNHNNTNNKQPIMNTNYNNKFHPPTPTARQYTFINIDLSYLPKLCSKCYAVNCICDILRHAREYKDN